MYSLNEELYIITLTPVGCLFLKLLTPILILISLFAAIPQAGLAKEHLKILPATPIVETGDLVGIQYVLPCNAVYRSVVLSTEKQRRLKTGVLVHFNNLNCVKMNSVKKTFFKNVLRIKQDRYDISPFIPKHTKSKVKALDILEMNKTNLHAGLTSLQVAYEKTNHTYQSSMLAIDVVGSNIELAILSFRKKRRSNKTSTKLARKSITVKLKKNTSLSKLSFSSNEVHLKYKILPIDKYEVDANILRLTYTIPCDSAPIGALLREQNKLLKIAVLTAPLPKKYRSYGRCRVAKKSTETFSITHLDLNKYSISHLSSKFIQKHKHLYLQKPTKVGRHEETRAYYIANCSKTLGLVYSKTTGQQVSLGVLKDDTSNSCDRNLHLEKLTLNMVRTQYKVKPLNIVHKIRI